MRILLVEDDQTSLQLLSSVLKADSVVSDAVGSGEECFDMARLYDYDLIVLDLVLPDLPGVEVLKRLRDNKVTTPVLVLSGLTQTEEKVKLFALGADDYLTKPFEKDEFLARVHAIIRRSKGCAEAVIRVGKLSVDTNSRTLAYEGKQIPLTSKEYAIVELLAMRKGTTLSKEVFLNHLYGGVDEPEVKIIDVFVCKLRKKIQEAAGRQNYIETVWGRGYLLREPDIEEAANGLKYA